MQSARLEAREKLARHHQAIAAVIAFSAQDRDPLRGERRELFGQEFHHAMPGVLHQHEPGNAHFDGAPIDLAHLGRGQHFHGRLATSMVISSCNSAEARSIAPPLPSPAR